MVPNPDFIIDDLRATVEHNHRCVRVAFRRALYAVVLLAALYLYVIWLSCK